MALKSPIFDSIMSQINPNVTGAAMSQVNKDLNTPLEPQNGTLGGQELKLDTNTQASGYNAIDPHPNAEPEYLQVFKDNEGYSSKVYKDTEGYDTVGYGHKLTPDDISTGRYANGITPEQADRLLATDVKSHNDQLYKSNPWARNQPQHVREVMEDMNYNLGSKGFNSFKNMISFIKKGDYHNASAAMLNSKYARQVGNRASRNSSKLRGI